MVTYAAGCQQFVAGQKLCSLWNAGIRTWGALQLGALCDPRPDCRITQSGATLPLHVASQPLTSDVTVASSTRSSAIFALIAPRCFSAKVLVSPHGEHRWPASQTELVSPMRVTMTAVKAPSPPRNGVDARRYSDER